MGHDKYITRNKSNGESEKITTKKRDWSRKKDKKYTSKIKYIDADVFEEEMLRLQNLIVCSGCENVLPNVLDTCPHCECAITRDE